jgi:DNA-binding CsgD family transcriptional regulator
MVIGEHEFYLLCERYEISPRQRQIVAAMLDGALHQEDLARIPGINPRTLASQLYRTNKKMHNGSMMEILYTFVSEAKAMTR